MSATFDQELEARRQAERAMRLLARPGAVVEAQGDGYGVRLGASRRRRVMLTLDEAGFQALAREATLKVRSLGGWTMTARPEPLSPPPPGRPGVIEEEVILPDASKPVRKNLGESPIAWLARRRDRNGQPWLTPIEAAAGERLREEFERLGTQGRLTMRWDAARVDGGPPGLASAERNHAARQRIASALAAAGPGLREILERVCLMGSALEAAESALKLPRRTGKTVLKLALQRLARHYRMV
ncbi:DUF6456 domain-containing protein [Caulobacter segnis]|uniref:DUF6456 domain-containing protein n=1 Tax=Caulobacter segnis TaxID=88688 RepID=UPI00285E424F|nr:DUF6456 domain-containing protein [Caulobacter segnis]MDR6626178.1 hypothetical protein [Caulobacter segnis]